MATASDDTSFGSTTASLNLLSLKLLSPADRAARINPIIISPSYKVHLHPQHHRYLVPIGLDYVLIQHRNSHIC